MDIDKKLTLVACISVVAAIAFWAGVIYVAAHFIAKWW
jgi:hypothetical protein